jgi:uncharacterized protein YutE (UPF0331/DUF86 family)
MSPTDRSIARRKLLRIVTNLELLEEVRESGEPAYLASKYEKKAAERWLQELIEAAIDLNLHILSDLGARTPTDSYNSFIRLGEAGVIPPGLAEALAPVAGFRNRLVHDYEDLDDRRVWEAMVTAIELFPRYVLAIEERLAS